MTQRLSQVQLARNTAKLRMEAANRRTAKLVDALADNIRLLAIERDKSARLGDELATKKSIVRARLKLVYLVPQPTSTVP